MNNNLNEDVDKKIANLLYNRSKEISAPEDMFFKIRAEILKENKGVFYNMKLRFLKFRTAIMVGILCIITTATCAATTSGGFWVTSSSKYGEIKSFPAKDTVKSTVGFVPKYVESFDGGFNFEAFNSSNSSLKNDDGDTILKTKDAHFNYKRDGAKKDQALYMNATVKDEKYFNKEIESESDITEYKGIKIYYKSIQRKIVPPDYKQTEEDLKLINEGLLDMVFGSDEIEEYRSQSVCWYEDGIDYSIINESYDDVSKDAMVKMAKSVIDQ